MNDAALLTDFDGVLRNFDRCERELRRLQTGAGIDDDWLFSVAFASDLLDLAVTGRISHEEWMRRVHSETTKVHGAALADALIGYWESDRGEVDDEVLSTLEGAKAAGWRIVLVTNATNRLDADLEHLGITGLFDAVVNASVVGHAKPESDFYDAALDAAETKASDCLFVDDRVENVKAAVASGMKGHVFVDAIGLRAVIAEVASIG